MQKMKKILCLLLTMLLLSSLFMIGCSDDGEGEGENPGQLTDAEWQEMLAVDIESINSVTISDKLYPTYSKDQVEEYGEWDKSESTIKIDKVNEKIYYYSSYEYYVPGDGDGDAGEFVTTTSISYHYKEGNKYYAANYYDYSNSADTPEWSRVEITKASFIEQMENYDAILMAFEVYSDPMMKIAFTYNATTGMYEMADYGGFSIGLKFFDGGVTLYESLTSLEKIEITVSGKNGTTVTIPDEAKNAELIG